MSPLIAFWISFTIIYYMTVSFHFADPYLPYTTRRDFYRNFRKLPVAVNKCLHLGTVILYIICPFLLFIPLILVPIYYAGKKLFLFFTDLLSNEPTE